MDTFLIQKIGQDLGLDQFHSELYAKLLESDEPTIADLTRDLGVYRLKIYQGLEKLEEMGFVELDDNKGKTDKISEIKMVSPGSVLAKLRHKKLEMERRTRDFEDLMPELLGKYYQKERVPEVRIFKGQGQFYQIFNQSLTEISDEILILGEHEDFYDIIDYEYYKNHWCLPRVEKKIKTRVLGYECKQLKELDKSSTKELREIKYMSNHIKVPGSMWIYGVKVIFWNTVLPKAIYIDDLVVANFCRTMFENIWVGLDKV
jgi:sugar-specific transcriptional regulator TrmB